MDAELVLRAGEPVGALNRATVLEAVELRNGPGPIPVDGAVLSGTGAAGDTLRELWARISQGRAGRGLRLQVTSPLDVLESLGVHPLLLHEGRPVFPPGTDGFTTSRDPRTLLGWHAAPAKSCWWLWTAARATPMACPWRRRPTSCSGSVPPRGSTSTVEAGPRSW